MRTPRIRAALLPAAHGRRSAARSPLAARRRTRLFTGSALAAFGGISALVQFVGQLYPGAFPHPGMVTAAAVGGCAVWGAVRARPLRQVRREYEQPRMTVAIRAGDLFAEDSHLVVGFSDTFDTDPGDGVVVNPASVQGQLLVRRYGGDRDRLDAELDTALAGTPPLGDEDPTLKPRGKLRRYPVGTVAVLGARPSLVFAVAYSRIGPGYVAASGVEELWESLGRLWDAVYRHGQQERVAMALVGSGLARLDLDDETLLRIVVLSFVARSRARRVCRELDIVLRPETFRRLDLPELDAFLKTLGPGVSHHR